MKLRVLLNKVEDVTGFVNEMQKFDFDVKLVSGNHEADAKSLLGVLTLDLSKPVEVKVSSDNGYNSTEVYKVIEDYIVR